MRFESVSTRQFLLDYVEKVAQQLFYASRCRFFKEASIKMVSIDGELLTTLIIRHDKGFGTLFGAMPLLCFVSFEIFATGVFARACSFSHHVVSLVS